MGRIAGILFRQMQSDSAGKHILLRKAQRHMPQRIDGAEKKSGSH